MPESKEEMQMRIFNWVPPPLEIGVPVLWFPGLNREREAACAFVTKIGHRAIELLIHVGNQSRYIQECRHKDDPGLPLNPYIAANGCWDYTPLYRQIEAMKADIMAIKARQATNGQYSLPGPLPNRKKREWTQAEKDAMAERMKKGREAAAAKRKAEKTETAEVA